MDKDPPPKTLKHDKYIGNNINYINSTVLNID